MYKMSNKFGIDDNRDVHIFVYTILSLIFSSFFIIFRISKPHPPPHLTRAKHPHFKFRKFFYPIFIPLAIIFNMLIYESVDSMTEEERVNAKKDTLINTFLLLVLSIVYGYLNDPRTEIVTLFLIIINSFDRGVWIFNNSLHNLTKILIFDLTILIICSISLYIIMKGIILSLK